MEEEYYLKQTKWISSQFHLEYLGHVVSAFGVNPEPLRIHVILDSAFPTNITTLRGFSGLIGFYCKFIKRYAFIATSLTLLLHKYVFHWNHEAVISLNFLKLAITTSPTLTLLNSKQPFVHETGAYGLNKGVVLIQNTHLISLFNKPFFPKLQKASTYVRELHAITIAIKKWREYLLGHKLTIFTHYYKIHLS